MATPRAPRGGGTGGGNPTGRANRRAGSGAPSGAARRAVPVRVVWTGGFTLPAGAVLGRVLDAAALEELRRKASASTHPMFRLADDVFVELPDATWRGGDLLVYLPRRGWLVRRNKVEHWYVDIGVFRPVEDNLYGWTDLWLDVVAPEDAARYHLLDVDQFAVALREGRVTTELAALALEHLDALVRCISDGAFPPPEVRAAEDFARLWRAGEISALGE